MGRPTDWSPVGWSTDPTPGNPAQVADLAERYATTALRVQTAADGLARVLTDESYKGDGGRELRERSRDVREQVVKLKERYATAGEALRIYAEEQTAAQQIADAALSRAAEAEALQQRSTRTLDSLDTPLPPGEVEDPAVTAARSSARRDQAHAATELQRARNAVENAHRLHDQAGNRAASKLKDVIGRDGLNDNWKDDVLGLVKQIANVAGIIAAIAGVLSLFLGWVPVLGQILTAVALLAGLVALLGNLTLALLGKGDWKQVMWDAISVATFGIGRVLSASGKLASQAARGQAWTHARGLVSNAVSRSTRYRRVREMLGGPLGDAGRAVALAAGGGALRAGLRATSPRAVVREAVEAGKQARQTGVGLRQAWDTMSGGSLRGVVPGLLGGATPASRALGAIDPRVLSDDAIRASASAAQRLTAWNVAPTSGGFGLDTFNLIQAVLPTDVDPPNVGVGSSQTTGLSDGFRPAEHISPTPAAP
jgi:hypothetical protein